jgi:hypothetical protein
MYMKPCETCGKLFRAKHSKTRPERKYCGDPCVGHTKAEPPVTLTCKACGTEFKKGAGELREYRKKHGHDQQYCSIKCSADGRVEESALRQTFACEHCGKTNHKKKYSSQARRQKFYHRHRFCNARCKGDWQIAKAAERFKRGEYTRHIKRGYAWLSVPKAVTGKKHGILEHRYVMQLALGRKLLPEETVHHRNGDTLDNRIENLELFSTNHGEGARITDKITHAIYVCKLYPQFLGEAGYELTPIAHDPTPLLSMGC